MDMGATGGSMPSFWQVAGALIAVLALLVLALKFLGRLQNGTGSQDRIRLLKVRRLGPKRDLETLQLDDEVFTIYRHDGGMVVLRQEPTAAHQAREPECGPSPAMAGSVADLGRKLKALAAAAGGPSRPNSGP